MLDMLRWVQSSPLGSSESQSVELSSEVIWSFIFTASSTLTDCRTIVALPLEKGTCTQHPPCHTEATPMRYVHSHLRGWLPQAALRCAAGSGQGETLRYLMDSLRASILSAGVRCQEM